MLEVSGLHLSYGMHCALEGIDIAIDRGEIVVILGANGAGKSSLLRTIAGMGEGTIKGSVSLDGSSLLSFDADEIVELGISFVPEGRGVFGDLSVEENLTLGAYSRRARQYQNQNLARVMELFPKLGERRKQLVRTMSGGEQQMVAIGRALMADPQILMLDEPSLGLSPLLCKELFQALSQVRETGMGILLVEQNAKQSLAIADRGYLIENGHIVGKNTAQNLLNDPAVQSAYLGASSNRKRVATAPQAHSQTQSKSPAFQLRKPVSVSQSGPVANDSIEAIVARASSSTHEYGQQKTTPSPLAKDPARAITKSPPELNAPRSPEVAQLLADMEQAARSSIGSTRREIANAPVKSQANEDDGSLPHIEVIRKHKIEIYKRNPDHKLVKVGTG